MWKSTFGKCRGTARVWRGLYGYAIELGGSLQLKCFGAALRVHNAKRWNFCYQNIEIQRNTQNWRIDSWAQMLWRKNYLRISSA